MLKNIERKSSSNRGINMQIVIPMSGFGERFRIAGYNTPKSLIIVEGKTIIQHVVEMFSSEDDFIFICNEEHLSEPKFNMRQILEKICPAGKIVSISPHKLGPVYTVMQSIEHINLGQPTVVNYCDFTCYWDYEDFKIFVCKTAAEGVLPCYRGFHPHTLWSNYYAYVEEANLKAIRVQEKQPFTNNPREEFASSGTYYFKSGALMKKFFQKGIEKKLMVNNEYYVSMIYQLMMDEGLDVYVYELEYFMQWGTPSDLEEYIYWSNTFRELLEEKSPPKQHGVLLLPMVGLGTRFQKEGYDIPKPLISVSGKPMGVQALEDLPQTESQRLVLRSEMVGLDQLQSSFTKATVKPEFVLLDYITDGQASTCVEGIKGIDRDKPVTIAACDNGMIYDADKFAELMHNDNIDVIVWGARGYPGAIRSPEFYGWIDADDVTDIIRSVSVKVPLKNPRNDPIIVGAFTFKRLGDFLDAFQRMKKRGGLVNNEYYVDTAINDAIELGKNCKLFNIDKYICWGTPNDLKTFEYWQSCFHKWPSHPYRLEKDKNIDESSISILKKKISSLKRKHTTNMI
jgi:NDP-sugar pyrophosphorylase family protein